ncbi:hypothetical protein ACQP00_21210 [Dactylosporangium sp. CS-047395]|uniref:hypothetical protein n=1 Tax=Dactylosporangium sp. CS-047395 TaxID=3239936 RepID=UPI003D8B7197
MTIDVQQRQLTPGDRRPRSQDAAARIAHGGDQHDDPFPEYRVNRSGSQDVRDPLVHEGFGTRARRYSPSLSGGLAEGGEQCPQACDLLLGERRRRVDQSLGVRAHVGLLRVLPRAAAATWRRSAVESMGRAASRRSRIGATSWARRYRASPSSASIIVSMPSSSIPADMPRIVAPTLAPWSSPPPTHWTNAV